MCASVGWGSPLSKKVCLISAPETYPSLSASAAANAAADTDKSEGDTTQRDGTDDVNVAIIGLELGRGEVESRGDWEGGCNKQKKVLCSW